MPERQLLAVNEAFYEAFRNRDIESMEEIWSEQAQISCIHPGQNPLFGKPAVMGSWAGIMRNPDMPGIEVRNSRAIMQGDLALVICHEHIGRHFLVATNVFRREDGEWQMVHHQAGEAPPPDLAEDDEGSGVLQ